MAAARVLVCVVVGLCLSLAVAIPCGDSRIAAYEAASEGHVCKGKNFGQCNKQSECCWSSSCSVIKTAKDVEKPNEKPTEEVQKGQVVENSEAQKPLQQVVKKVQKVVEPVKEGKKAEGPVIIDELRNTDAEDNLDVYEVKKGSLLFHGSPANFDKFLYQQPQFSGNNNGDDGVRSSLKLKDDPMKSFYNRLRWFTPSIYTPLGHLWALKCRQLADSGYTNKDPKLSYNPSNGFAVKVFVARADIKLLMIQKGGKKSGAFKAAVERAKTANLMPQVQDVVINWESGDIEPFSTGTVGGEACADKVHLCWADWGGGSDKVYGWRAPHDENEMTLCPSAIEKGLFFLGNVQVYSEQLDGWRSVKYNYNDKQHICLKPHVRLDFVNDGKDNQLVGPLPEKPAVKKVVDALAEFQESAKKLDLTSEGTLSTLIDELEKALKKQFTGIEIGKVLIRAKVAE